MVFQVSAELVRVQSSAGFFFPGNTINGFQEIITFFLEMKRLWMKSQHLYDNPN